MSYVPRYILKRMVKEDAIKKVEGGGSLTLINMIMPLSADLAPSGNPLDYVQVKINDEMLNKEEMEAIEIHHKGGVYTFATLRDADVIAVGDEVTFVLKSDKWDALNVGDEVTIEIMVPEANVNLKVTRALH
ncbi:MAG: hypothetical protein Kow0069_33180 [Promethearchaeota archaeon]